MKTILKMSPFKALLALAAVLCFGVSASAQLSGAYTIGGTSPDYATIDAALTDLETQGISAAVTFNIRTGTYTEHVALSAVTGSDSVNTITFQAESLDSSDVTITYATQNLNDRWTFALFGTSYVTFQHLSFENTAPSVAGACLYLDSANTNTTVQHCAFSGPQTQTYQQHAAAIYATNSFANHHIVVRNCEFTDNEYGVHIRAPYSPSGILNGTSITNCKFTNQFRGAIATSSTIGLTVSNNDITTNSSTASSITVSNCSDTMYV